MAYIGVQPTDTYLSIASQQITGNGGATYTLDYSVSDEESVAVFVNNVRQNVSTYTVSGTSLTLGGTISASDSCWVLFLGRTVGTKTPAVGSVTNDMLAGSIANSKLANSSITLNGSAVSLGGSATVGGNNTPYFEAYLSANQTGVSQSTHTKIQLDTENFDSGGMFDNSTNYRFTPTESGKYYIYGQVTSFGGTQSALTSTTASLYKNGSRFRWSDKNYLANGSYVISTSVSAIVTMNGSTDYIELYGFIQSSNTPRFQGGNSQTYLGGYKIIE